MTDKIETNELNFEEMLEESLKNFNTNERVMGTVLSIAPNEVQVDVGRKQTGFIPASELSNDPNARPEDVVKVGDTVEVETPAGVFAYKILEIQRSNVE